MEWWPWRSLCAGSRDAAPVLGTCPMERRAYIAREEKSVADKPYMIGIAGPSCSGKSELAMRLASRLPCEAPLIFSLDDYYRDLSHLPPSGREQHNFDDPDALEAPLIELHLSALASGEEIHKPRYRFDTHTRAEETDRLEPASFVIVEGLYALYWSGVRRMLGTKVFIETDDAICFARRLERDVRERGRNPSFVVSQCSRHTRPMYERHVLPTKRFADVVVQCKDRADAEAGVAQVLAHLGLPP